MIKLIKIKLRMLSGLLTNLISMDPSGFLRAKKEHVSGYLSKYVPQNIFEIPADLVPTYPRVTVFDIENGEKESKLLFDSSDFLTINYAFNINSGLYGQSLRIGNVLNFRERELKILDIRFDILDIFDDYSKDSFGKNHTAIYEGKDIPYNIQIFIYVEPMN